MMKIRQNIIDSITILREEEKMTICRELDFLRGNLLSIFGMKEPWLLILDHQILMDLENKDEYKSSDNDRRRYLRLLAVFLVFEFLIKYTDKEISIVITPCTLFEFNRRQIFRNKQEFISTMDKYVDLINNFCSQIAIIENIKDYKNAKSVLKCIDSDEKRIIQIIRKLKTTKIDADLYIKHQFDKENRDKIKVELFKPPILIGYQIASKQKLRLNYFDKNLVYKIIASHIEEQIYRNNARDKTTKKKINSLRDISKNKMASLSKIKNNKLKGLADIEIIQYCNLSFQFSSQNSYTLFAISFDGGLVDILQSQSSLSISSEEISGRDSLEVQKDKLSGFFNQQKRLLDVRKEEDKVFSKLNKFIKDITVLFL